MIAYHGPKVPSTLQQDVQKEGWLVKGNKFDTTRGKYIVEIVFYKGALYFAKYKDDKLVEFINLDKESQKFRKENNHGQQDHDPGGVLRGDAQDPKGEFR